MSGVGSGAGTAEFLATRCTADADCGPDGICALESDTEGGPAGGYCTTECSDDGDCEGEGSACLGGMCYLGCIMGEPEISNLDDRVGALESRVDAADARASQMEAAANQCTASCQEAEARAQRMFQQSMTK